MSSGASTAEAAAWYALAVYARQEKAAATELRSRGVTVFLPVRRERRAWSDRIQSVELALFPGYLFVHTSLGAAQRRELLKPRQTIGLVGQNERGEAPSVPVVEIESLERLVAAEVELDPIERLVEGTPVRVVRGPLKGAVGIVERGADGQRRLIVQIELLGRGVRTTLSGEDVLEDVDTGRG